MVTLTCTETVTQFVFIYIKMFQLSVIYIITYLNCPDC